jgi:hypothetical protein
MSRVTRRVWCMSCERRFNFMPETSKAPKPTEDDVNNTKEEDNNLDRDGGERQPNQQADRK